MGPPNQNSGNNLITLHGNYTVTVTDAYDVTERAKLSNPYTINALATRYIKPKDLDCTASPECYY